MKPYEMTWKMNKNDNKKIDAFKIIQTSMEDTSVAKARPCWYRTVVRETEMEPLSRGVNRRRPKLIGHKLESRGVTRPCTNLGTRSTIMIQSL